MPVLRSAKLQNLLNCKLLKYNNLFSGTIEKYITNIASEEKIYFHGFTNTILGEGHWNETGHEYASKLISRDICNLY